MVKTPRSQCKGPEFHPSFRELDPTCHSWKKKKKKKTLCAIRKIWHSQIDKFFSIWPSLVAQMIKSLPTMEET